MPPPDPRTSVVVLTHNRADELARTLRRLQALPEQPHVIVVDNASSDATAARLAAEFSGVERVRCPSNLGAAGRNLGVARVQTPYVAFCDDDTWWEPHALRRAADLLDAHPTVGAVAARVLVGPENRTDPTCLSMAGSPLERAGLPGPALIGFMAGAVVMRAVAFREVGGYEGRFFIGGEEALMGLDLAVRGWRMVYADDVVTHHHPSPARDVGLRRALHTRNLLWLAWMRLPWASAWDETKRLLQQAGSGSARWARVGQALRGLPWVLRERRVLPPHVHRDYVAVRNRVLGRTGAGGTSIANSREA